MLVVNEIVNRKKSLINVNKFPVKYLLALLIQF